MCNVLSQASDGELGPLQCSQMVRGTTFLSTVGITSQFETSRSNCFQCSRRLVHITVIRMKLYSTVVRFLIILIADIRKGPGLEQSKKRKK